MANFDLGLEEIGDLVELMLNTVDINERIINDVFHNEGAMYAVSQITPLIESQRRTFKGHRFHAGDVNNPFTFDTPNLELTIAARGKFHYLYFPDDGSNTLRHYGNRQFMERGGELATPHIIQMIQEQLITQIEGG